jgi:phosphoserine phosphatase
MTLTLLKDQSRDAILRVVDRVYQETLRLRVFPEARRRIQAYSDSGWHIVVISSTYLTIAEFFKRDLPLMEIYATDLRTVGSPARFTGEIVGPVFNGPTKVGIIEEFCRKSGVCPQDCHAFGDHVLDQFMLGAVGRGFAVNPDRAFPRLAKEKGFEVLEWNM